MKLLEEVAKQFGTSKPVFKAVLSYEDSYITFELKDPYQPNKHGIEDPIARIIAKRFQEKLSESEGCFVQCTHMAAVYEDIIEGIELFVEEHSPLKNPTQSKLYKWVKSRENGYKHPTAEGFIGLYRYIYGAGKRSSEDVQNILAILEMMREKYEDAN